MSFIQPIYIIIIFAWTLIFGGLSRKDLAFTMLGGILSTITGLNILKLGLDTLTGAPVEAMGIIMMAGGIYVLIRGAYEFVRDDPKEETTKGGKNGKEKKK